MKKDMLKNIEWGILICTLILIAIGMVALYSSTQGSDFEELKKQVMWLLISIPIFILFILVDYKLIARFSPIGYGIILVLLVLVLFTTPVNGATSWFDIGSFSLQPAEFAKIFVILMLAQTVTKVQEKNSKDISNPIKLGIVLLVVAVPVVLIIKQPDYGTGLAFLVATLFMLFVSGIDKKYIIIAGVVTIIAVPLLYFFILPEHAKTRIDVFLNPDLDPRGAGYNVIQSKLAIGAGQLFGMGIMKGNQTQLGFLYPKTTDFIFSVIGEEMGFVVGALIIILYVVLITKAISVAKTAKDDVGAYIGAGIAGVFLFHMVENIGMTMGLLPITGVPLPFVSYGGSSLLTNLILIGLLLNVSSRRKRVIYVE